VTFVSESKRPAPVTSSVSALLLQRSCLDGHCEEDEDGGCAECRAAALLQRRPSSGSDGGPPQAPPVVADVLRSPGVTLEKNLRYEMESLFLADFSRVRVHADAAAGASARAVAAEAYTVGPDIVFGAGSFAPGSAAGRRLLAHELAHVVQQDGAVVPLGRPLRIGPADDPYEHEAERASALGDVVPHGRRLRLSSSGPVLQRASLWQTIVRFFGGGTFSDDELEKYLRFLDVERRIEDNFDSDNKAREVVHRWKAGDARYLLPVRRKLLLIQEMLSGWVSGDDQHAILDLIEGSGSAELEQVVSGVGEARLSGALDSTERKQLTGVLETRRRQRAQPQGKAEEAAAARETFPAETVLEAQGRFTSNAELERNLRKNCIEIVRSIAPQLLGADPKLAREATAALAKLRGKTLTMEDAMRALADLGGAVGPTVITFNNSNGNAGEPTEMHGSAWDTIVVKVGNVPGWHIFGLALFDGYHSVTIFVDNRPSGPIVYWADQWAIDPGEDFGQVPGSVSGFRRYERTGLDAWITQFTRTRWNTVHSPDSKCAKTHPRNWETACRYSASLKIWKFQSRPASQP
jgi:hypothetical protein